MTQGRARAALALICAASVLTLVILGTRLTFFNDEWAFLLQRPGFTADSLLEGHNGHLSVLLVVLYKGLVAVFGLESQLPFRLVLGLCFVALGVVTYALVSERLGRPAGLVAATLLLFLGPAWEDLLWSFQIGFVGSLAAGLGALLALERDSPRRNAAACGLLVLSIGFSDVGLPLVVGAAIAVALRRRPAQAWIPLVPLLLFGAWYATYGVDTGTELSSSNLRSLPTYLLDSAATGIASLSGFAPRGWFGDTTAWGRPLLAVALAAVLVGYLRGWRPSAQVLVFLGAALTFWTLAGANYTEGRAPASSRYQLVHATFLVLIAAELLRGLKPGRWGSVAALALACVALGSNLSALASGYRFMRIHADNARAGLGALEIARDSVPPGFRLVPAVAQDPFLPDVTAGRYFSETGAHGSPAWSPAQIVATRGSARQGADSVLVAAHRARPVPARKPTSRSGCQRLRAPADVQLPAGGLTVSNLGDAALGIGVRRFAPPARPRRLGPLAPRATVRIAIPPDAVRIPWRLTATGASTLQVCAG